MIGTLLAKLLASRILATIGKTVFISLLEQYAESTETKVDDKLVASVKAALE